VRGLINLLEYALISLARRWKKNLALIIIYALVVGFFASVVFLSGALNYESQTVLKDLPELWIQKLAGDACSPCPCLWPIPCRASVGFAK
jgi:predicted PurR-regulated permease PerM